MDEETRDRFAHVDWRLKSLEARAWPDAGKPAAPLHRRLDAIEDMLRQISAAVDAPRVVVDLTTGVASEIRRKPVTLDGLDGGGERVSWSDQQDPTTWGAKAARLTPDATPGVVDPDDRAALARMADKLERMAVANADAVLDAPQQVASETIEGADAAATMTTTVGAAVVALRLPQSDQHTDYWRAGSVDARRESIRTPRKWWLLWLA